jgi:hypothetical protein
MSRRVIRSAGLFSLAGFLVGLTALHTRADSPLNFIPEDAVIVARVKNPAQMAAIPVSWVPEKFRPLTIGLLGPMLPLWRDDLGSAKEWWAVVYCEPAKQPTTVYILQSYDIEGAKKRHPHEGQLRIAEWQVLGDSAASAARLNECRAGRIKSLGATMESKVRQVFDNHSASLFVNAKRLRALYRTELDGFKNEISVAVEKSYRPDAASGLPGDKGNPGANPAKDRPPAPDVGWTISDRNAFEAAVETWHGVCHFLEEAGTGAVGLAIDDKGCELEAYVTVEPNSATDQFLARQPPSDMRALNRLPPGALLYFGISGKVTDFAKWLAQWRISNLEQTAKLKEALEKKRLSSVSAPVDGYFGSVDFGRDIAGPATSTLVISGSGAPNFREFENRLIELSGGSAKAHFPAPSNTTVKRNAEMISRHDVDVATMKLPDKPDAMTDVGGLALLKGYYGSSGFAETRTVTLPGLMAQTTGGGRLAMARLF